MRRKRLRRPSGRRFALRLGMVALLLAGTSAAATPTLAVLTDNQGVGANTVATITVQPPTGLTVTRPAGSPVLSWTASTTSQVAGYNIYAAATSGGPYAKIGTVSGRATTTWTDPEPTRHITTFYVVTAYVYNWASGNSVESAGAAQDYASTVLADGPVGYWRLGSAPGTTSLPDSSGNGFTATLLTGTPLGQPSLLGTSNNTSMSVDGTGSQGATVAYNAAFNITSAISIELWVKTPASMGQSCRGVFDKHTTGNGTTGRDYDVFLCSGDNSRVDTVVFSGMLFGETAWPVTPLVPNTVHHIVITATGAGVQHLYLDGTDQGYVALSRAVTATPISAAPLRIGLGDSNYWNSLIDEVSLYNKVLTPAQALAHYRAGTTAAQSAENAYPQAVGVDKPLGYWRLGDAPGATTFPDYSGNGRTATVLSGTTLGQPSLVNTSSDPSMTLDGTGTTGATVPYNAAFSVGAVSIEMWVRTPAAMGSTSTGCRGVFNKSTGVGFIYRDYDLYLCSSDQVKVTSITFSGAPFGETTWTLTTPLAASSIHHIVATATTSGSQHLYLDGVDQGAVALAKTPLAQAVSTAQLRLGMGDNNYWNSGIDEITLYNKVLTPTQVATHFNAGSPVPQWVSVVNSGGKALVAWQPPPADDAYTGYAVYRGTTATSLVQVTTVTGPTRSFLDPAVLTSGATYYYAVAALTPAGTGQMSAPLPFTAP